MLRTPRTRLSAIKYVEKKMPRDLEAARAAIKAKQVYISKYTIKVQDQRVVLNKDTFREGDELKRLETMVLEDYFYFYYPAKEKLVINALLAGL